MIGFIEIFYNLKKTLNLPDYLQFIVNFCFLKLVRQTMLR